MPDKINQLNRVKLSAPDEKTQSLTIRLDVESNGHEEPIVVSISFEAFARLAKAFQVYQKHHKLPIPQSLRPKGKPALSIVSEKNTK